MPLDTLPLSLLLTLPLATKKEPFSLQSCCINYYICNMNHKHFLHTHTLHRAGFWLSILCTIHCLAMPFLITALPFLSESFISQTAEIYLIGISFALAAFLLSKDYRGHRNVFPLVLLFVATIFNFSGLFLVKHTYETIFVIIGAIGMAAAYIINWWWHKRHFHGNGKHQH